MTTKLRHIQALERHEFGLALLHRVRSACAGDIILAATLGTQRWILEPVPSGGLVQVTCSPQGSISAGIWTLVEPSSVVRFLAYRHGRQGD